MIADTTDFQRARRPEQKERRKAAILAAARRLVVTRGVRNVTLGDIAAEVGLHKSAVLAYVHTLESAYLQLAIKEWHEWAGGTRVALAATPDPSLEDVATALVTPLESRPLLCDLLAHAPLSLERHVPTGVLRDFKVAVLTALDDLAGQVVEAVPGLARLRAQELVFSVSNAAGMLWQIATPPPELAELYAAEPELGHDGAEFGLMVRRFAHVHLRGLLALGD